MFEVGFTEILLIFGIALLVLGPERLPKLAADLGRWAGRARAMARQLRAQLEQEVNFDPLRDAGASPNTIHRNEAPPAPGSPSTQTPPPETSTTTTPGDSGDREDEAAHAAAQKASDTPRPAVEQPAAEQPDRTHEPDSA
jgi:sec-independent protein translocase protein TatB